MLFLSQSKHNYSGGLLIQALIILLIATISILFFARTCVTLHMCSHRIQKRLTAINYALDYAQRIQHNQLALHGMATHDAITITWQPKNNRAQLLFHNPIIKSNDIVRYVPVKITASWQDKDTDHQYVITTGVYYEKD